ncbi:glucosylceramidase-like protein [Dinothrombium tinctorium]|uniref:Glucosylceramidase n=1 Tax=Dinothrombium tinctorium TaxID=1965070 RepID=A0A443RQH7_9ACAR|nr:glucosylceramidase-like protein [Dinothrombium tinctorium]
MCFKLFLAFVALFFCKEKTCNPQDFGAGSVVCVCNITYCDEFEPVNVKPGFATIIESSKDGKRFFRRQISISTRKENKATYYETDPYFEIKINRAKKYQRILGFGGAFTDSATINIESLPSSMARRIVRDYYSNYGIQYNVGRIPIGGCDFSTRPYTYDDVEGDFGLKYFSLSKEDLKFKMPSIKYASKVSKSPLWLFASAWSAPTWMKTSNSLIGGTLKGKPGGKYYEIWANYLINNGILVSGLTAQNEPQLNFPINSMNFSPKNERDFIKFNLGPALKRSGYISKNFSLIIVDDDIIYLKPFTSTILSDKIARKYVSGIAYHWYKNNAYPRDLIKEVSERYPDKLLLSTEACIMGNISLGNWSRGEAYAKDIIEGLNRGSQGWVDWNLALNMNGGPNWVNNYVDAPIIVNSEKKEYYKNPMFYILGHFSKLLAPNSIRIDVSINKSQSNEAICAAFETSKHETIVIVFNPMSTDMNLNIRDPNKGTIVTKLQAKSIMTIVYN